ncbi:MAG: hypothetical protein AAF799_19305 [Myxococcota bacterium]
MLQTPRTALLLALGLFACDPGESHDPDFTLDTDGELDSDGEDEFRQLLVPPPGWNDEAAIVYTEIVLATSPSGALTRDSSRLYADPVFWFENWSDTPGQRMIRDYLDMGVRDLTGTMVPHFIYEVVPPPDPLNYIVVKFTPGSSYGQAWAEPPAPYGGVDHTGGRMLLPPCDPQQNAFLCRAEEAFVRHELAHVLFGDGGHSGNRRSNMGYSPMLDGIDPLERLALNLHFSIPRGTSFQQLEQAGIITTAMLDAHKPRLEQIVDTNALGLGSAGERGDTLEARGSYLRYPYGRSRTTPAGWTDPTIMFTGAAAVSVNTGHSQHENNFLSVTVPATAESGPATLTGWSSTGSARTSEPMYFHVQHPALDNTCSSTYSADEGVYKDYDFITRRYIGSNHDNINLSFKVDAGGAANTSYDGDWDCFCFSRPWDPLQEGHWYSAGMSSPDLLTSGINYGADTCAYNGPGGDYLRNEAWCYSVLYGKTGGGTAACLDISQLSVQ